MNATQINKIFTDLGYSGELNTWSSLTKFSQITLKNDGNVPLDIRNTKVKFDTTNELMYVRRGRLKSYGRRLKTPTYFSEDSYDDGLGGTVWKTTLKFRDERPYAKYPNAVVLTDEFPVIKLKVGYYIRITTDKTDTSQDDVIIESIDYNKDDDITTVILNGVFAGDANLKSHYSVYDKDSYTADGNKLPLDTLEGGYFSFIPYSTTNLDYHEVYDFDLIHGFVAVSELSDQGNYPYTLY